MDRVCAINTSSAISESVRIRELREKHNLSQNEIAGLLNAS